MSIFSLIRGVVGSGGGAAPFADSFYYEASGLVLPNVTGQATVHSPFGIYTDVTAL